MAAEQEKPSPNKNTILYFIEIARNVVFWLVFFFISSGVFKVHTKSYKDPHNSAIIIDNRGWR